MVSFKIKCFIPVALSVIGIGLNLQSASAQSTSGITIAFTGSELQAQTTKNFEIKYNTLFTLIPKPDLGENIFRATITGESTDAAFELNNFVSNTYGKLVKATETTQEFEFNADPTAFGLQNLPVLGDEYFGGDSKLFGIAADRATINFATQTVSGGGTITLTGGTGIFNNASGQITFTQQDKLDPTVPPGSPVKGEAILKFTVDAQKVPEPTTTAAVASMGVIGAGSLLRRNKRRANSV
jgi:hypothetical protein